MDQTKNNEITYVPIARLIDGQVNETLYRNMNGDYWLTGTGDKTSHWAGKSGTQPLTESWAIAWIRQNEHSIGYEQLFDYGITENKQKRMISANLQLNTYRKLQSLAVMHNCTKTDILEDLISSRWASEYPNAVYEPAYDRPMEDTAKDQSINKSKKDI